jgi:molecular chaperone HscB
MSASPDHFEVLGLPRRFALDPALIERNYLARSRELHPDFHQLATSSQQRASLEMTAVLNEAYSTLREPFKRAEYLLALHGGPTASEHKQMPPDFLEEMLELRMQIEELREGGIAEALTAMEHQLQDRRSKFVDQIAFRFEQYERSPGRELLVEVRQLLNKAKYIQGQLRDLRAD